MELQGNKWLLYIYVIVSLIYLLSVFFDNELLELLFKPTFLPVLLFYYFEETKKKYSISFVLMIFSYYFGEMLMMVENQDWYPSSLIFFLIPYFIIIYKFLKENDYKSIKFNSKKNNAFFIFILSFFCFVLYNIHEFVQSSHGLEYIIFNFYGVILLLIGLLATLAILYDLSIKNNNTFIALIVTFSLSDMFFLINKNVFEHKLFEMIYVICQNFSYYYILKYYLNCHSNSDK